MKLGNSSFSDGLPPRSFLVDAHSLQDGQTQGDEYLNTLKYSMPEMQSLFEKFGSAEHPDFMTIWAAISEMVAFYTEPRHESGQDSHGPSEMSQNKCRFCY